MRPWHRWLMGVSVVLVVAPGVKSGAVGLALAFPVVVLQILAWRRKQRDMTNNQLG